MTDMGIGLLGAVNLVIKRKFRWTFEVNSPVKVPKDFVKLAARPNLSIEETELNYLNAKTWIPGKASWETISVTYYDVANSANMGLWSWIAHVYDCFSDDTAYQKLWMGTAKSDYAGEAELTMYDGCGDTLERWTLLDAWPQAINFGELDYSSSEEATIELTLRYSQVRYFNACGGQIEGAGCMGCNAS